MIEMFHTVKMISKFLESLGFLRYEKYTPAKDGEGMIRETEYHKTFGINGRLQIVFIENYPTQEEE